MPSRSSEQVKTRLRSILTPFHFVSKRTCCLPLIQTGCNADASAACTADVGLRANGSVHHQRLPAQAPWGRQGGGCGRRKRSPQLSSPSIYSFLVQQFNSYANRGVGGGWIGVWGERGGGDITANTQFSL